MDALGRFQSLAPASDKKGHSTTLRIDIAPGTMEAIAELVASRRFPWIRTPKDFHRIALGYLLEDMSKLEGGEVLQRAAKTYKLSIVAENVLAAQEASRGLVETIMIMLDRAKSPSEKQEAVAMAHVAADQLDDPMYIKKIRDRLQDL